VDWAVNLVSVAAFVVALIALQRTRASDDLAERVRRLEREAAAGRAPVSAPAPTPPPPSPAIAPPRPAPVRRPPLRERVSIDWEQLLGIRAAAVLGGSVLALAGLMFFRYSIEHGLIPPWLRVVVGAATGVACVVGAEWRLRERSPVTANAHNGAGIAIQ
jgi:uncharacterized membrane protein